MQDAESPVDSIIIRGIDSCCGLQGWIFYLVRYNYRAPVLVLRILPLPAASYASEDYLGGTQTRS